MPDEHQFTREQELLMQLRKEKCGDNAAELARKLKLDSTYVNRLFYPIGKKGRKGIGLKVMRAASEVFNLPPGFWEGADKEKGAVFKELSEQEREMLFNYRRLLDKDRKKFDSDMAAAAEERQQEADELFARFGVAAAVERANARRLARSSSTIEITDQLKQRSLLDPSDEAGET